MENITTMAKMPDRPEADLMRDISGVTWIGPWGALQNDRSRKRLGAKT